MSACRHKTLVSLHVFVSATAESRRQRDMSPNPSGTLSHRFSLHGHSAE